MSDLEGPPSPYQLRSELIQFVGNGDYGRAHRLATALYEHCSYLTDHLPYEAATAYELFYLQGFMHCLGHVQIAEGVRVERKLYDDKLSEVSGRKSRKAKRA